MEDMKKQLYENITNQLNLFGSDVEPAVGHIWEMKRLESLKCWTMAQPSSNEMAESGFYCPNMNYPGTVKCFSCFIELDGWEPTDKPWEEHKKRALACNPPCKFIEIGKKESDFTVDDYLEILKSVMIRTMKERCEMNLKKTLSFHRKKKSVLKKDLQKLGLS